MLQRTRSSAPDRTPGAAPTAPPTWRPWTALALALLVMLPYVGGLGSSLVYDDRLLLGQQPWLGDAAGLWPMVSQTMWQGLGLELTESVGYWRPLFAALLWAGSMVSHQPWPHELLPLLAHAVGAVFARRLARRLGLREPFAFLAALLFGVHAVHVENLAWISAGAGVYSGALLVVTLERFAAWRAGGSRGVPWAVGCLFAAALLAKESAVAVLPMALAIDLCAGLPRPAARRQWIAPYLALGMGLALWIGLRTAVFGDPAGGLLRTFVDFGVDTSRTWLLRVEFVGGALGLLGWPAELVHTRAVYPERGWTHPAMVLPIALTVAAVLALVFLRRRGRGPAAAGLALTLAALAPLCVRPEGQGMFPLADRFLYQAALGAAVLAAAALARLPHRPAALAIGAAAALGLGVRGALRVPDWNDDRSFWSAEVALSPDVATPHWSLGRVELERYRQRRAPEPLIEAFVAFNRAQDIAQAAAAHEDVPFVSRDDVYQANLGVAWCLVFEAEVDGFNDFTTARELGERIVEAHPLRAAGWVVLAVAEIGERDLDAAEASLRRALELHADFAEAHHNLGQLLLQRGRFGEARRHFERALALRPDQPDDLLWSARANAEEGRRDRARELGDRMAALYPNDARPLVLLAVLDGRAGDRLEALDRLERAVALDPENGHAHAERGKVLLALGRREEALLALRRACEFGPDLFEPHYNLAALLLEDGLDELALPVLMQAYRLGVDPGLRARLLGELAVALPAGGDGDLALAAVDVRRGDFAAAEGWIERRLAARPDDPAALVVAAKVSRGLGRPAQALERLERAVELAPEDLAPRLELARFLEGEGDRPAAARAYREALARVPEAEGNQAAGAAALRAQLEVRAAELEAPESK
ncbi:MAG: tetratricopeptide repeat protein [Planctomycetaceae bacterium]|nr:tetratricopeptide repeat protein [Planctomycetaceae bacterium]